MRKTIIGVLAAACLALPALAQDGIFSDKDFQTNGRLKLGEKTVYLPVTQVKWMTRGKFTARGGAFRRASVTKEVVAEVDQARVQKIAQVLHDDLVAQFEAAGWNVQTRQELGADVPAYKAASSDGERGFPVERINNGVLDADYALIAPPGMPTLKATGMALAGITLSTNRYVREKPGVNLLVNYGFATAELGETNSRQLGAEASPSLMFTGDFWANTASSQAMVMIRDGVKVADDIGTLEQASRTGMGTKIIRGLAGMSSIDKTGYTLVPDWDRIELEAIRGGKAFNAQIVARMK